MADHLQWHPNLPTNFDDLTQALDEIDAAGAPHPLSDAVTAQPPSPAPAAPSALPEDCAARPALPAAPAALREHLAQLRAQGLRGLDDPQTTPAQMQLEGWLLTQDPAMDFAQLQVLLPLYLETGETMPLGRVDHHRNALAESLETLDAAEPIAQRLDDHISVVMDTVEAAHVRNRWALGQAKGEPAKWLLARQLKLDEHSLATLQSLDRLLADLKGKFESNRQQDEHWTSASRTFDQALELYRGKSGNRHEVLCEHLGLYKRLQELEEARSTGKLATVVGAGVTQMLSSWAHFGYIRSAGDMAAQGINNRLASALLTGLVLGTGHEAVSNLARPWLQLLADRLLRPLPEKVSPIDVLPDPLRFKTEKDGTVRRLNDPDYDEALKKVQQDRVAYHAAQQDHGIGTLHGDFTGFGAFAAAQALKRALEELPGAKSLHLTAAASALGGFTWAGLQTQNMLNKRFTDAHQRRLPTHKPGHTTTPLGQAAASAGKKTLKALDLREAAVREGLASKVWGASQGLLISGLTKAAPSEPPQGRSRYAGWLIAQCLRAAAAPPAMLPSFFANNMAGAEAQKSDTSRAQVPMDTLRDPDRAQISHGTLPGTASRALENTYHVARGILQVGPQALTTAAELATASAGHYLAALGRAVITRPKSRTVDELDAVEAQQVVDPGP